MTDSKNPLLDKLKPLITPKEIDEFEEKEGFLKFDVMIKQKDDEKTYLDEMLPTWWRNKELRYLANNIYDQLDLGFEIWIREPTMDETAHMSEKSLRYAISLEADNMEEDGTGLLCRLVSGWLVISEDPESDVNGPIAQKFYDYFKIFVETSGAPDVSANNSDFDKWYEKKLNEAKERWKNN